MNKEFYKIQGNMGVFKKKIKDGIYYLGDFIR